MAHSIEVRTTGAYSIYLNGDLIDSSPDQSRGRSTRTIYAARVLIEEGADPSSLIRMSSGSGTFVWEQALGEFVEVKPQPAIGDSTVAEEQAVSFNDNNNDKPAPFLEVDSEKTGGASDDE